MWRKIIYLFPYFCTCSINLIIINNLAVSNGTIALYSMHILNWNRIVAIHNTSLLKVDIHAYRHKHSIIFCAHFVIVRCQVPSVRIMQIIVCPVIKLAHKSQLFINNHRRNDNCNETKEYWTILIKQGDFD